MSGGVDSSYTAYKLKQEGHEVIGVFMKNWDDTDDPYCSTQEDHEDIRKVCEHLEIPYYTVNFEKEYQDKVFANFLEVLEKGHTPNPDILCNKEIKFKLFLDYALKLGADKIATGHYARVEEKDGSFYMLKGVDSNKDQTYFLYTLGQKELSRTIFPIGDMPKEQVRKEAEKAGIHTFNKKDSTGICFIGERKFKDFISKYLPNKPGDIIDENGNKLAEHKGLMYYTLGQRKGIEIGGEGEAWFVAEKKIDTNQLVVVQGKEHPLLFKSELQASSLSWVTEEPVLNKKYQAKVRYRQEGQECEITELTKDHLKLKFTNPQRAITPGQSLVLYDEDICLGGGIIK